MALVDGRTAFELCLVQQRKDNSRITGLAVNNDGLRYYVGLNSGFIEEHKVVYGPNGCVARVCARRQASKKAVKRICLLGGAGILAVLIEDGQLLLCDLEQLDPVPLADAQHVAMVASDPRYVSPCRFAVGIKSALRRRVDIYEVSRDWDAQPSRIAQYPMQEDIKGLVWLGEDLIVVSKMSYFAIRGGQVQLVVSLNVSPLYVALPIPALLALLCQDGLVMVCDVHGTAARPPLIFDSRPLLLTHGGMCIVAVTATDGIAIYDQQTSKLVQRIPFSLKNLRVSDEEGLSLHHADSPSGSTVLLSSAQSVWMLRPVAHEAQTVQLLKSGNITAALELAKNCATDSWAEDVCAQAGLLLLRDQQWEFAMECLERCAPSIFQPSQLFPLFPEFTRKWADRVCSKAYWGLHGEITKLGILTSKRTRSDCSIRSDSESVYETHEETTAQHYIAKYLLKCRNRPNTHCLEGIDTLIIYLLSSVTDLTSLEDFVQTKHQAELDDVRDQLMRQKQFVALALLCWKKGRIEEALKILKDLSFGKRREGNAKSGSIHQANGKQERVALYYASRILAETKREAKLVEEHLKWLVDLSPIRFLYVCQGSSLPSSTILSIISEERLALQFRYLHHLVHTNHHPSQDTWHHTHLALVLCRMLKEHHDSDFFINEEKYPFMLASDDNYYQYPDSQLSTSQKNILAFDSRLKPRMMVPQSDPPKAFYEDDELNSFTGQELRDILQRHLLLSKGYDALVVRQTLEDTNLYEEQVILHCRLQDHLQALKVLAIQLRDIRSAISLLDMLLKPDDGIEPFFADAVQVLNAESGNLDPIRVLDALSETMPLAMAYPTLARMLRERTHKKRQTRITCNLHRIQNVLYKAEKYDLESSIGGRVCVDAETECVLCRKPLGGRIFYKYPSGANVCGMCQRDRSSASVTDTT